MRFSLKITLLSFCIVLLSFGALFWTANREFSDTIEQQLAKQLEQKARFAFSGIDKFIYERFSDALSIASEDVFISKNSTNAQIGRRLEQLKSIYPHYLSMSFFDTNRVRIADTGQRQIGTQHTLTGYWVDIYKSDFAIDISYSESMQLFLMHFAFMIRDEDGRKRGVFVSRLHLDKLYEAFVETLTDREVAKHTKVDLLDENQLILYSTAPNKRVLSERNGLKFEPNSKKICASWRDTQFLNFCVQQKGYKSYGGNRWSLVLSVPQDVAFADARDMQRRLVYTLLPIVLLVLVAAYVASKFIARPIKRLTEAATELGDGKDFNRPIRVSSNDEIGKLASAFNRMAIRLQLKMKEQGESNEQLSILNEQMLKQITDIRQKNKQIEAQNLAIATQQDQLQKAYDAIADINAHLTESIRYAQRIQRSMLPEWQVIQEIFQETLLFYEPKDVVGGDFYWFEPIQIDKTPHFFLAVADCTGHGVPGGFMSMLGSDLLNSIIPIEKCYKPRQILQKMNDGIKKSLHQSSSTTNSQDGMEIALCCIDLDTLKMQYAGARRPLYLFRKGDLHIFDASKVTIGGVERNFKNLATGESPIESQQINLKVGDVVYLFTDGFKDQFGGEHNKKYSTKRFRDFLESIHQKDLKLQQELMAEEFAAWKGNNKQTDDVLVLAFKV